jgi:hypothetical protein
MKGISTIIILKELAPTYGRTGASIRGNGPIIKCTAKDNLHGLMADATKVNTKKIKSMDMVHLHGQTEGNMTGSGKMESKMEMEFIQGAMEREGEANGVREGGFNGKKIKIRNKDLIIDVAAISPLFFIFENYNFLNY